MRLSPSERRSRAVKDHASLRAIAGELIQFEAFRAVTDRRPVTVQVAESGGARVYVVTYNFPTLERGGGTRAGARIRFDLTHDEYPFRPPTVQAALWAPWLPHVHGASGMVCLGPSWAARAGRYVLGDLVVHVARILNADEPSTKDAYDLSTVEHLRSVYGGGPINRGLALPVVPPELTHGTIEVPKGAFTIARTGVRGGLCAVLPVDAPPLAIRRVARGGAR